MRRSLYLFGICAVSGIALAGGSSRAAAEASKIWSFQPQLGFIDDVMAFDTQGQRFACLHGDSAKFLTIKILALGELKEARSIEVPEATLVPKKLLFSTDGTKIILIAADGQKGAQHALLFDTTTSKLLKKVGPATMIEVAPFRGEQCITLTEKRTDARGSASFSVTAYRTQDLRRLGAGQMTVLPDQTIAAPALRFLYWERGHLTLMGMKKGKYDKQRDIRLPEQAVRFDVVNRKEIWKQEPQDIVQWVKATNMRPKHPHQLRFLQVSEDLKSLFYASQNNDLWTVPTPVDWTLYEPKSLKQKETWDGEKLFFTMTVDPVNAIAVRRKKADQERMDLYRLDPGPKASLIGQVPTEKRRFSWTVGPGYFAYLRKLKGFGRGGTEVILFRAAR
jgi:hypothetical protein